MKLAEVNSYRGAHSHSITRFDETGLVAMDKRMGAFKVDGIYEGFNLCHIQAPTTVEKGARNIHPAEYLGCFLWHNGIIKAEGVKRLQHHHRTLEKWDTMLLLQEVIESAGKGLSVIDGSFACMLHTAHGLYVFRNEISPLFYNQEGDFSSVRSSGLVELPPNIIFKIRLNFLFKTVELGVVGEFTTFNNPFFFGDVA